MVDGQIAVEAHLRQIFTDHPTAAYVGKIRDTCLLGPDVVLPHAVAVTQAATWRITLYQNTPAQCHGRPELIQQLADELRQLLP